MHNLYEQIILTRAYIRTLEWLNNNKATSYSKQLIRAYNTMYTLEQQLEYYELNNKDDLRYFIYNAA